jgi:GNAT superfamily N-acetyltransferase
VANASVKLADDNLSLRRCFPVMQQLRPHLTEERYLELVAGMAKTDGYRIAYVEEAGGVAAAAGFRLMTLLYTDGPVLYVDDLVSDGTRRSRGHGNALMRWLVEYARQRGCLELHLDSGVQRFDAHRFYFRERMHVSAYHFRLAL